MTRVVLARTLLVFFLSAPVVAAQAPAPPAPSLTLAEAVRVALEKNPTVQAADAYAQVGARGNCGSQSRAFAARGFFRRLHARQ